MKLFQGAGREIRRGIPISAYVGANGAGKTLAMVHDTLPSLAGIPWQCEIESHRHTARGQTAGVRRVLSTVQLLEAPHQAVEVGRMAPAMGEGTGQILLGDDGEPVRPHRLWVPLTSWSQLVYAEHCDVLLDEVTGAASSRSYQSLPPQLIQLFLQLRKVDVQLRYTTPNWSRTDVVLREVTQSVTVCKGFFWERTPGLLWPSKRLFRWATYDAMDWEEMSMEKVAKVKPLLRTYYWRPGKPAMDAYNTREAVSSLDHMTAVGLCLECGGKRAQPKCDCDRPAFVAPSTSWPAYDETRAIEPGQAAAAEEEPLGQVGALR